MNVVICPINHYCIVLDDTDLRKGWQVVEAYSAANNIRGVDSKWQYGRTADGHRTVNFNGFVATPISTGLEEDDHLIPKGVDSNEPPL